MFLATSVATRTCASTVDAPRCGVAITRSCAEQLSQDCIITDGFLAEDIERHSCQSALSERSQQRLLVDQAASCAVHQVGTRLEQSQFTGAKQPARRRSRHWRGWHAASRNRPVAASLPCCAASPRPAAPVWQRKGSLAITRMPKACRSLCHLLADLSQTDDAEHLAVQLDTQQAALVPPARFDAAVGGGNVSCQRQQQRNGMFGNRNRTPSGCIDHQHAVPDRGIQIDVVQARPGTSNNLQVSGFRQQFVGDSCLAAYNQRRVAADQRPQVLRREIEPYIDVRLRQFVTQQINALLRDGFGNQDAWRVRFPRLYVLPLRYSSRLCVFQYGNPTP